MSTRAFPYEALASADDRPLTRRRLRALLASRRLQSDALRICEHDRSGRSRLFVVDFPAGSWLAKRSTIFPKTECWFYAQAAGRCGFVPSCLLCDRSADVVMIEYMEEAVAVSDLARRDPAAAAHALSGLAAPLVQLHALGASLPDAPHMRTPFPELDPIDLRFWTSASPAARAVITTLQSLPRLSRAYARALDGIGPKGLVHGDLKPDNVLLCDGRMLLVDWETCGRGPVGWDLGAVVGSLVMMWVDGFSASTAGRDGEPSAVLDIIKVRDAVRQLVDEYRTGGLQLPTLEALTTHTAAWMVGRTWAEATMLYYPASHHTLRLLAADELLGRPDQVFGGMYR